MKTQFDESYYFGNVYDDYDNFLNWEALARDMLALYDFDAFLDIGCGCGNLVEEIRKQQPDTDVQGVDISEYAVAKANVPYIQQADCTKLPFEDLSFDLVFVLGTFAYLPTEELVRKAMDEAYRVCKSVVIFEDVYSAPEEENDDFDPFRKQVFTKEQWMDFWKECAPNAAVEAKKFQRNCRHDILEIRKK